MDFSVNNFELENWLPMEPLLGPPLPRFLGIYWPWYKPTEEIGKVAVALRNPPSDAENWTILLTDWDITVPIHEISGKDRLGITEAAVFEIPSGVKFPLRVAMLQLTKWKIPGEVLQQVYYAQAMHANQYDWDAGTFTGPPDPTYKEAFIPEYGSYYYNVATERLEKV